MAYLFLEFFSKIWLYFLSNDIYLNIWEFKFIKCDLLQDQTLATSRFGKLDCQNQEINQLSKI